MQKKPWAIYVWPGLPHIWTHGSWPALYVAVMAAVFLIVVMVGSFGWSELIVPPLRTILWMSLAIVWGGAAVYSAIKLRRQDADGNFGSAKDIFNLAMDRYLKGDFYQAERLLLKLLEKNPRDLDARLLLATLMRHTGRIKQASEQLDKLSCFEGAEKWALEIQSEQNRLIELKNKLQDKHANGMTVAQ
jgi:tetratricopeptide (TPR) repeat protein